MFAEMWEGRSGGRQKICLKAVEVVAGGQSLSAGDGERDDGREGEGDPGPGGHGLRQNLRVQGNRIRIFTGYEHPTKESFENFQFR